MKDIKTKYLITIVRIMDKYNFEINEITSRRINNYHFQPNTIIAYSDKYIKISTEEGIKGVYNVLLLFSNGLSKVHLEFE